MLAHKFLHAQDISSVIKKRKKPEPLCMYVLFQCASLPEGFRVIKKIILKPIKQKQKNNQTISEISKKKNLLIEDVCVGGYAQYKTAPGICLRDKWLIGKALGGVGAGKTNLRGLM